MDDIGIPFLSEQEMAEELRLAKLDAASGRVVPWADVKARLLAEIEDYQAKQARQEA